METNSFTNKMKVLIVTAVDAEKDAVVRGLNGKMEGFEVVAGGVGQVAAAVSTTKALMRDAYDLVISAGIGGGFVEQAEVGSVVISSEIIAADLGAETADGYCSIEKLGFGSSRIEVDQDLAASLAHKIKEVGLTVKMGPILTLSTVTGTKQTAVELAARIPGASVEAMEGFGVATAAADARIPVIEIRTISNPVGPRDREAWKIKEALHALEKVSSILPEVLR